MDARKMHFFRSVGSLFAAKKESENQLKDPTLDKCRDLLPSALYDYANKNNLLAKEQKYTDADTSWVVSISYMRANSDKRDGYCEHIKLTIEETSANKKTIFSDFYSEKAIISTYQSETGEVTSNTLSRFFLNSRNVAKHTDNIVADLKVIVEPRPNANLRP